MTRIKVTTENIEEVRDLVLASDMAEEIKAGIVPALAESLKGLREDLKALPPVHCNDEKVREKRKTTSK